ncbi:MAG TPA: transglutaminase family protein [Solirubrobacteraceae bacterium]|nr:transglutaminase family protein [Solirubrobacteraceae bacterium]
MNFAIRYLTEYAYDAPVSDNLNALRVRPATTSTQRCDEFSLRLDPEARVSRHADYFGTEVLEFGIAKPHENMSIDVRARVVTSEPPEPLERGWDQVGMASYREAGGEFLIADEDRLRHSDQVDEMVASVRRNTPIATLRALDSLVVERFDYRTGVTYVGSTVDDLLDGGGGVCQDFAHLTLLVLRRSGIAARYVSGYLWAAPTDGGSDSMEVQTHAWVEALLPGAREPVWVGADPTNDRLAGETHVKIGHGRNYSDVPPIKGVFQGRSSSLLSSRVTMSRLDPAASARP